MIGLLVIALIGTAICLYSIVLGFTTGKMGAFSPGIYEARREEQPFQFWLIAAGNAGWLVIGIWLAAVSARGL